MANNEEHQLRIEIDPAVAKGFYTNLVIISHSETEFVVDLASTLPCPGQPRAQVLSRAILAPQHAKRLLLALQENVMRYEREHGKIELDAPRKAADPLTADPFSGNNGEA